MRKTIETFGLFLLVSGAIFSALTMVACFLIGLSQIGVGLFTTAQQMFFHPGQHRSSGAAISELLSGLEFLFIAPLPFLAYYSTVQFFRAVIRPGGIERTDTAHALLIEVKTLISGLMIAVLATELLHRFTSQAELSTLPLVGMLSLIAVLTLYIAVSDRMIRKEHAQAGEESAVSSLDRKARGAASAE